MVAPISLENSILHGTATSSGLEIDRVSVDVTYTEGSPIISFTALQIYRSILYQLITIITDHTSHFLFPLIFRHEDFRAAVTGWWVREV